MVNTANKIFPPYRIFESGDEVLQTYPNLFVGQENIPLDTITNGKFHRLP